MLPSPVETQGRAAGAERAGEEFLTAMRQAYEHAARDMGEVERVIRIGGQEVLLRFAGPALIRFAVPAFAHSARRGGSERMPSIRLWDTASTGVGRPEDPWSGAAAEAQAEVRVRGGERFWALFEPGSQAATVVDVGSGSGHFHVPEPRLLQWHEHGAPLRGALHWLLMGTGRRLVHAGAVALKGRGALIAGRSGAGKSTLALACLQSGLGYLGDDYVLITDEAQRRDRAAGARRERFFAHSVYSTAKASRRTLTLVGGLDDDVIIDANHAEAKAVLELGRRHLSRFQASTPLSAVVIPRLAARRAPSIRPTRGSEALKALAPSTLLQHRGRDAQTMAMVAELARTVPTYVIELGRGMAAAADAVRELLDDRG